VLGGVAVAAGATGAAPLWLALPALGFAVGSLLWLVRLRPQLTSSDVRAIVAM
jgi:hypothetical protein